MTCSDCKSLLARYCTPSALIPRYASSSLIRLPARDWEKEDNEVGRIVPISASGLEYFVDVLVESELRVGRNGLSETCVHRVIKSNNRAFPIGLILENPTFTEYLTILSAGNETGAVANAQTIQAETHARAEEQLETMSDLESTQRSITERVEERLHEVLAKVESLGYTRENLVTVANQTFGKYMLSELTEKELAILDGRLDAAGRRSRAKSGKCHGALSARRRRSLRVPPATTTSSGARSRSQLRSPSEQLIRFSSPETSAPMNCAAVAPSTMR